MPRISVVVPVYNVEAYLEACLQSIAGQTVGDLEVVMVDDGSTDGSAAIAETFAARDGRFRLVRQANAGLGAARNTGIAHATGEYLAFVDSDDVLPPDAYERLLGALERSGSDFATGNVLRLREGGARQAYFLSRAFLRTRLNTHVTRQPALLADRTAWNKLWRRSFWDAQGYAFPVGVLNEDIPVVIPAHFAARSVDVVAEPVYLWRSREEGERSITQQRLELRALEHRLNAVERVIDHLAEHGPPGARGRYERHVVADDLRYHVEVLDEASEAYRQVFLDRVTALLDRAEPGVLDLVPAHHRRRWELIRARDMDGLVALLRRERGAPPPLRIRVARRIPERHRRRLRGMLAGVRGR